MLIRWLIALFAVSVRCKSSKTDGNFGLAKTNSSTPELNFDIISSLKPKRQLDDFDFDSSSFEGPSIFVDKSAEKASSFEESSNEDLSVFIPTSFKVTRSNAPSLGTHGYNSNPSQKPADTQNGSQSNEDQAISQAKQASPPAYENQVTTPYFNEYIAGPRSGPVKPNTYLNEPAYKPPPRPVITEYAAGIPVYGTTTQIPGFRYQAQPASYRAPPFKVQFSPSGLKNLQPVSNSYAPLHYHNQQNPHLTAPYNNYRHNTYNNVHFTTSPTVEFNGRKLPLPVLQLQTDYPTYVQALETTPIIYSAESGIQYKTEPGFGVSFDFAKPKNNYQRAGTNAPFLGPLSAGPIQLLPLQTSSSTAQFPKYKGASVAQHQTRGFSKIPNDYQELKSQPQLHFDRNNNNDNRKTSNYNLSPHSKQLEEIRSDVEIIKKDKKKKKKPPPRSKDEDEDEEDSKDDDDDEGYKNTGSYLPRNDEDNDDDDPKKNFKESESEGDFLPSKSYPFKEYDEKFGKYKKNTYDADEDEDDDDDDKSIGLAAKYRYETKSEDDDDDNDNLGNNSKPKYKAFNRYNDEDDDEDEERSHKHGKRDKLSNSKKRKGYKEMSKIHSANFEESQEKTRSKPKNSQYRYKDEQRSHSDYHKPGTSKKNRHRTYRDKTSEISNGTSLIQTATSRNFGRKPRENSSKQDFFKMAASNIDFPKIWQDSYGIKMDNLFDDEDRSTYSKEEADGEESAERYVHEHLEMFDY